MTETAVAPYRVLARKYRPASFAGLIGQEAMVRTLSNAIANGRLAHAFILTGVRGIGKTTTARIIARALNCTGPDGQGGPTIEPCGVCDNCRAIAEDRHVDVLEMDAASRTGIGDIREIIDSVRYAPGAARFKIYIIDEVHMLSTAAFNGLLKTLEEPPAHVKFIFATTEIRKVPITVLSRCQRFDLRRVEAEVLIAHLESIAGREGVLCEGEALALIARAAEGSVRDALSLLDQAIAHAGGMVQAEAVRAMLGLADRARVFDLFEQVMRGDIAGALTGLRDQYDGGADPLAVLQDLLELTHWLTRIKVTPAAADDVTAAEGERRRGREMAAALSMPVLARTWQMLLKGLGEARMAPQALAAVEMVLVRLAYVAEAPPPGELVRQLQEQARATGGEGMAATPAAPAAPAAPAGNGRGGSEVRGSAAGPSGSQAGRSAGASLAREPLTASAPRTEPASATADAAPAIDVADFDALVALAGEQRDAFFKGLLINYVHLVHFEPDRVEFRPASGAPPDLAPQIGQRLRDWTGRRWMVSISTEPGAPTLAQAMADEAAAVRDEAAAHPLVRAALDSFPGASISAVRALPLPGFDPDDPAAASADADTAGEDMAGDDNYGDDEQ